MTGLFQRLDKGPSPDPTNVRYTVRRSRILEKIPEETGDEGYPHIPVFSVPVLDVVWPSQGDPTGTTAIKNVGSLDADEQEIYGADGSVVVVSPSTVDYVDGGFYFGDVRAREGAQILFPAGSLADIVTDQEFLVGQFLKLPEEADWNTSTSTVLPFWSGSAASSIGPSNPTLGLLGQISVGGTPNVAWLRQRGTGGAVTQLSVPLTPGDGGSIAFAGGWRGGNEGVALWTPANGLRTATTTLGALNTASGLGATIPRSGVPLYGWPADMTTGNAAVARKWSWLGHFIEDLAGSGRSALDVIDTAISCAEDLIEAGIWS